MDFIDLGLENPNVVFVLVYGEEMRPIIVGTSRET